MGDFNAKVGGQTNTSERATGCFGLGQRNERGDTLVEWATSNSPLNISTGPVHFSDRRASTLYLSLARQDHRVKCRASRLKITVARSMTNFATFSCILFLKFRYVCNCLTSVHNFLRKLFLTTLSSLCVISHEYRRRSGKNGGQ